MVDSALLPEITRPKSDKATPARNIAAPAEPGAFEKVQADLSEATRKSARSEQARRSEKADRLDAKRKEEPPAPAEQGKREATSSAKAQSAKAEVSETKEIPEIPQAEGGELALFMPGMQPVNNGNVLPPGAPALAGPPGSPRELFLQMAQGVAPGQLAEGKAALDPQVFKATLAEAADGKLTQSVEAPGTSLTTGARGVEIREGSAIIRQYSTTVETPVQQGDWGDKMAGKISWLASQRISLAEIHVNPPDMGPIDVRVSVQNDQASVAVHAANPSVRDLLELHGNRLRDMMQENGMNLARMDVSDQPSGQQRQASGEDESGGGQNASGTAGEALDGLAGESVETGELHVQWQSQVDTYA